VDLSNELRVFLLGCAGGSVNEVLHWWNLRTAPEFPEYARRARYWVLTVIMVVIGGSLAVVYLGASIDVVLALHIGLSAPLILQKLAATATNVEGARGGGASVRKFLRW